MFDKVTDKNKMAPFYGPRCIVKLSAPVICAKRLNRSRYRLGFGLAYGPRNHVLDGGLDPPWKGTILVDRGALYNFYIVFTLFLP